MKKIGLLSLILFTLISCQKLDSNLFNADTDIESYLWDEFTGAREFHIGDDFPIDESEMFSFTVESDFKGDKALIHALYMGDRSTISSDTILVYCHGNAGHMDYYWERVKLLYYSGGKSRYGVLMMDYRGFGLSEGRVNEPALAKDVEACITWLKEQGAREEHMVMYGFSLGSIPAIQICMEDKYEPMKLFLEAPIGNIDAMVQGGSSLSMPSSFFTEIEADNIARIKDVDQALFLLHGRADSFLPYLSHGKPIFDNHRGSEKNSIVVDEGEHGDTPKVMGLQEYMQTLDQFIRS
jgi:alpha/beta superfamily hydrolase